MRLDKNWLLEELRYMRNLDFSKDLGDAHQAGREEAYNHAIRLVTALEEIGNSCHEIKETKYYIVLNNTMCEQLKIDDQPQYLNYHAMYGEHNFDDQHPTADIQTQFTESEANEWVNKLDTLKLELVEVADV